MKGESGVAGPVLVVVLALVVLLVGGISSDLWRVLEAHRTLTGHVDAAATAASGALDEEAYRADPGAVPTLDPSTAQDRACAILVESRVVTTCPGPDVNVDVAGPLVTVTVGRSVDLAIVGRLGLSGGGGGSIDLVISTTVSVLRGIAP